MIFFLLLGAILAFAGGEGESVSGNEATYVGQQTCISSGCHADYRNTTYQGADAFLETMHATVHKVPSQESILIDRMFQADSILRIPSRSFFEGAQDTILLHLRYEDDSYLAQLSTTDPRSGSSEWLRIDWTFGGNGWLQRYTVEISGSRYVLPFEYVLPHYRDQEGEGTIRFLDIGNWFAHETGSDHLRLRTVSDQTFLSGSWDNTCIGCHVSSFSLDTSRIGDQATQWIASWPGSDNNDPKGLEQNSSISCESCHGPGSLHVADPENRDHHKTISPKFWDPSGSSQFWTDRKLDLCNQCHNRHHSTEDLHPYAYDDVRDMAYRPGENLEDFIRDPLADGQYWGDGISARAHHQTGQDYIRSKHYTKHIFANGCYDCHRVHNNTDQPYMLNRDWYTIKKGEGCTSFGCHSAFANTERRNGEQYNLHTAHQQKHSQCVNCHYTKTASFGRVGHFEFSDHSDQVLNPRATIEFRNASPEGMPNTCALSCHRNGYGDRNRPDAFFDVIEGEAMRAPDFGIVDTNLMVWNEPSDIALADSLWNGFKRLYPQFVSGVRTGDARGSQSRILSVSPNPMNEETTLHFNLAKAADIRIRVYDTRGRTVRTVADAHHQAGQYTLHWNRTDDTRRLTAAGVYVVQLEVDGVTHSTELLIVR